MDPAIIVAIIGVLGSATVAVLNHHLANRIKVQGKEIAWIKTLIRLVLSDSARANLKRFAEDGPFVADIQSGSGFEWELRHLLSLQLIDRVHERGMRTLFAHAGDQNVKDHLVITERGRDYLRLFEEVRP
jgi:hypothetical protein